MPCYRRLFPVIQSHRPFRRPTRAANLALLIGAILVKRAPCLPTLAGAVPIPPGRQIPRPGHGPRHRLKRLSRLLANDRVDPAAAQLAFLPAVLARRGNPRGSGPVVDRTRLETTLPHLRHGAGRRACPVRTIGVPRRGRALPRRSGADAPGGFPVAGSRNTAEPDARARVLDALPPGLRAGVVGDRALGRAGLLAWPQERGADDVLRLKRGARISEKDRTRRKLGEQGTRRGEVRWVVGCRHGTSHDKPRGRWINLARSWRLPRAGRADREGKEYTEPWYLAPSRRGPGRAVARYRQRMGIGESVTDRHSPFRLDRVQVASAARLGRLVAARSLALAWLHLLARPHTAALPPNWAASVVTRGHAALVALARALLDAVPDFTSCALPDSRPKPA